MSQVCTKLALKSTLHNQSNCPDLDNDDDDDDGLIDMLAISSMMPAQTNGAGGGGLGSLLNGHVGDDYQEAAAGSTSLADSLTKQAASCLSSQNGQTENSLIKSFHNFNLSYAAAVSHGNSPPPAATAENSRSSPSMINNSNNCFMSDMARLDHHQQQLDNTSHCQQLVGQLQIDCGICHNSSPINGGKTTLAGCAHSFCQGCFAQLACNSLFSSNSNGAAPGTRVITCPICSQDSLLPLDETLGDLLSCYSNQTHLQFDATSLAAASTSTLNHLHNNPNNSTNLSSNSNSSTSNSSPAATASQSSSSLSSLQNKPFINHHLNHLVSLCKICANGKTNPSEVDSSAIAVVKCLDCNFFLCFNCFGQHKNMPSYFNHRIEALQDPSTSLYLQSAKLAARIGGGNSSAFTTASSSSSYQKNGGYMAFPDFFNTANTLDHHVSSNNLAKKLQHHQFTQQLHRCVQQHRGKLESEINHVFGVYVQAIKERRDYLIKEIKTFYENGLGNLGAASKSNGNGNGMMDKGDDGTEIMISEDMAGQLSHMLSIEFFHNLNAIPHVVLNSFGFLKLSQQQQSSGSSKAYKPRPIGPQQLGAANNNSTAYTHFAQSHVLDGLQSNNNMNFQAVGGQNTIKNPFQFNRIESPIITSAMNNNSSNNSSSNNKSAAASNSSENGGKSSSSSGNMATSWSSVVANRVNQNNSNQHGQSSQAAGSLDSTSNLINGTPSVSAASSTSSTSSSSSTGLSPNNEVNGSSNDSYLHDYENSLGVRSHSITNTHDSLSTPVSLLSQHGSSHQQQQQQQQQLPARSQLKRAKMTYNCKFGEFGVADGLFTEPSGVAINANNDIIVADTNSHRIQIFDKDGRFKFKFGTCGKREGQLLYPNRVAVYKQTGEIVVTERSPTHQIQVYNQFGQFLRKFGSNILQHPRGVCVDSKGRIIVVECKVMRVIIFDLMGNVLQKFNCSKYLEFPNGCCCSNDREEIFISDNRAHSIKVFNYDGQYLRQIGGEGITNYPIGVGINSNGEVLVADNHNNFNLTVFSQDGQRINALESKVKHAQCFDVALMEDGSIVLASKDYRIYVYKYLNSSTSSSSQSAAAGDDGGNSSESFHTPRASAASYTSNGSFSVSSNSDPPTPNSSNVFNNPSHSNSMF